MSALPYPRTGHLRRLATIGQSSGPIVASKPGERTA
jgi:hypothetical protein